MVMRFILFQIVVVLADRIRGQNIFSRRISPGLAVKFSDRWAVVIVTALFAAVVVVIDVLTSPQLNLWPLYLLPCMVLTLTFDRRWGTAAAIIMAVAGPITQRYDDDYYKHMSVELWNTVMRFIFFQTVVFILDRIRRENVLFSSHKSEDHLAAPRASTDFPPDPLVAKGAGFDPLNVRFGKNVRGIWRRSKTSLIRLVTAACDEPLNGASSNFQPVFQRRLGTTLRLPVSASNRRER